MADDRRSEVVGRAAQILGSREEALAWMRTPQIGLDGAVPEDLLGDPEGRKLVLQLLIRMEFGVYS